MSIKTELTLDTHLFTEMFGEVGTLTFWRFNISLCISNISYYKYSYYRCGAGFHAMVDGAGHRPAGEVRAGSPRPRRHAAWGHEGQTPALRQAGGAQSATDAQQRRATGRHWRGRQHHVGAAVGTRYNNRCKEKLKSQCSYIYQFYSSQTC